jgi:diacylglycerol kinase (ATP)
LAAVAEALPEVTAYDIIMTIDDSERVEVAASHLVVASGRYMAAGVPIAPAALIDDGRMNVLAIVATTAAELVFVAPLLLLGTHVDTTAVTQHLARRLTLSSMPPMPFHVDGAEFLAKELTFELLPRALRVIIGDGAAVTGDGE